MTGGRLSAMVRRVEAVVWRAVHLAMVVSSAPTGAHTAGGASRQGQWRHHPDTTDPDTGFVQYLRQTEAHR